MTISAIVAVSKNGVIGKDGRLPWHLSADLKYFKRTTLGHHVIMGRKTFESIGQPLPKRTNIVVSRNPFFIASSCLTVGSVEEALQLAASHDETEAFIIGGAQIFHDSLPYWDRLYLTEVDTEVDGDVWFPEIDWSEWKLVSIESHEADEKNEYNYTFKVFEHIQEAGEEE